MRVEILFKKLFKDVRLPTQAYLGDAGFDLYAYLPDSLPFVLEPRQRKMVPCGFAMALPFGWEAQIRPRSGNAIKKGLTIINSPGTIDCNYRAEVKVLLINLGNKNILVNHNDRIAQMVVSLVPKVEIKIVDYLPSSKRGERGFGSSDNE